MNDPVITISDLSRQFGKTLALNNVSVNVRPGMVFGLVGENGAGKTTLIKHIMGLLRAKTGRVSVFGLDPVKSPVEVLSRIGYLSEDRELPDWMQVGQFMRYTSAFFPSWDSVFADELKETFELPMD